MGVLACNRVDCDNIMCDRYNSEYGYICDECFEELVTLGIHADIKLFMRTSPNRSLPMESRDYFDKIFAERK